MKRALFWHKRPSGKIQCELCPNHCLLAEGESGLCKVRKVTNGILEAEGYGLISAVHSDPIEKKPLYHFYPGQDIFSIGGWGCNLACQFCQNWTISQAFNKQAQVIEPDELVKTAIAQGSKGIAYTYNEPIINIEFVYECAKRAKERNLLNILVTNGYIEKEPAAFLLPYIDALNIDIKSMESSFYSKYSRGSVEPILRFAAQAVAAGCHVETTNLLIPGLNDSSNQVKKLSAWIKANLGENIPLHLSAYRPEYKMTIPPTPVETLLRAYKDCKQDLNYVYLGNVWTEEGQDTNCPQCGNKLITRRGYTTHIVGITDYACSKCGRKVNIVLSPSKLP